MVIVSSRWIDWLIKNSPNSILSVFFTDMLLNCLCSEVHCSPTIYPNAIKVTERSNVWDRCLFFNSFKLVIFLKGTSGLVTREFSLIGNKGHHTTTNTIAFHLYIYIFFSTTVRAALLEDESLFLTNQSAEVNIACSTRRSSFMVMKCKYSVLVIECNQLHTHYSLAAVSC